MEFEWDPNKAERNWRKHTINFEMAIKVFLDPWRIEEVQEDDDDGIPLNVLGIVEGNVLLLTYTVRADVYRIISARPAERHERRLYHEG